MKKTAASLGNRIKVFCLQTLQSCYRIQLMPIQRRRAYLKTHEVAASLDVSLTTIYNWLREGRIPEPERNPLTKYRQWTVKDVELIRNLMTVGEPE